MEPRYEITESEMEEYRSLHFKINDERRYITTYVEQFCAFLYAVLLLLGLISNAYVFRTLITIARHRQTWTKPNHSVNSSVLIYLIALCLVDATVIGALPLTILDVGMASWLLPSYLCSVYWIAETMNKIMTSIISASLSLSCYFSVCRYNVTQMYKNSLVAALILALGLGLTCWQAAMALKYADAYYIGYGQENDTINIASRKCLFNPSHVEETIKFTISSIICGYGLPVVIMLMCYAAIVKKVFEQSRLVSGRISNKFRRTAISVATLIIFYFFTWTPYWMLVIALSVMNHDTVSQNNLSIYALFVHVLPFLNSAFSPLVYIYLNRNIRSQYKAILKSGHCRSDTTGSMNNRVSFGQQFDSVANDEAMKTPVEEGGRSRNDNAHCDYNHFGDNTLAPFITQLHEVPQTPL